MVNQDLARFIIALLPEALESTRTYRTLTGFTASVTMDYLSRMKKVDEEIVAFLLPALVRTFATDSNQDCAVSDQEAPQIQLLMHIPAGWLCFFSSTLTTLPPKSTGTYGCYLRDGQRSTACKLPTNHAIFYRCRCPSGSIGRIFGYNNRLHSETSVRFYLLHRLSHLYSLDIDRGFTTSLTDCFSYIGVERLVLPLLPSLVRRYVVKHAHD